MRIYTTLKKEFTFLKDLYGFEICAKQTSGAYYYIRWTNLKIRITTVYDCRESKPVKILVYDIYAPGTIADMDEYVDEFVTEFQEPCEQIRRAAEWLKRAIEDKKVMLQSDINEGNNSGVISSKEGAAFLLPQKISPYFNITKKKIKSENTLIYGDLTCCGAHEFEVQVAGKVKRSLFAGMYLYSEDDAIVLTVRCKSCGKEISVFNGATDGYDNVDVRPQESIQTSPFACEKCANNNFSVSIKYEYPDVRELEELGISQMDKAFTWIWVTLECNSCGRKYKKFIDFETA